MQHNRSRPLGRDDVDRAARTLHQIAAIESLQDGVVVFDVVGLAGGWWYTCEMWGGMGDLHLVAVAVPPLRAGLADCRRLLLAAIDEHRHEIEHMARAIAHPPPDRLWRMASRLELSD